MKSVTIRKRRYSFSPSRFSMSAGRFRFCNADQLYAIYMQQLNSRKKREEKEGAHLDWDTHFQMTVKAHFYSIPQSALCDKYFGNGGYARNLLEQTITCAIERTAESNQGQLSLDVCLTPEEFALATQESLELQQKHSHEAKLDQTTFF